MNINLLLNSQFFFLNQLNKFDKKIINIEKKISKKSEKQEDLSIDLVKEIPNFSILVFVKDNKKSLKPDDLVLYQTENGYYKLDKIRYKFNSTKEYFKIMDVQSEWTNMTYNFKDFKVSNEINLNDDDIILVKYKSNDKKSHEFPYKDEIGDYDLIMFKNTLGSTYRLSKYYENDDKIYLSNSKRNYTYKNYIDNFYKFVKNSNFNNDKYQVVSSIILESNND